MPTQLIGGSADSSGRVINRPRYANRRGKQFVVLCVTLLTALTVVGCGNSSSGGTAEKKLPTRDRLRKTLMHMKPDDVVKELGKPNSTQDRGGGDQMWYYEGKSVDPVTGNIDSTIQVVFEKGFVVRVNY